MNQQNIDDRYNKHMLSYNYYNKNQQFINNLPIVININKLKINFYENLITPFNISNADYL